MVFLERTFETVKLKTIFIKTFSPRVFASFLSYLKFDKLLHKVQNSLQVVTHA